MQRIAMLVILAAWLGLAQDPMKDKKTGTTTKPCDTAAQPAFLEHWWRDYGQLAHYRDENRRFAAQPGKDSVVFLGDSITQSWELARWFPGRPYVNRGISAQTTSQMLLRFRQDVIELHPRAVVILAGTNDLALNSGREALDVVASNLASMADLAHANGIRVVFASVLPFALDGKEGKPVVDERIVALNGWLRQFCSERKLVYADYYGPMSDSAGALRRELSPDGVHPNADGYRIMTTQAEKAIQAALAQN